MKVLCNERGFSLIEVLASVVIFSTVLLLLANFLIQSYEVSGNEDAKVVAMNLARQTAEQWKNGAGTVPADATLSYYKEEFSPDTKQIVKSEQTTPTSPLDITKEMSYENLHAPFKNGGVNKILISLPASSHLTINERTYSQTVELRPFGTASNPLILITVTAAPVDKPSELALFDTALANPNKGNGQP